MAPIGIKHDSRLEAGLLTRGEKNDAAFNNIGPGNSRPANPTRKTSVLQRAVLTWVVFSILALGLTTAASLRPHRCPAKDGNYQDNTTADDSSKSSQVWNSVSPGTLHDFLHKFFPDQYPHGLNESDQDAAEVVEPEQETIMPKLPQLLRRQDDGGNGTVTTTSTPPDTASTTDAPTTTTEESTTMEESTTSEETTSEQTTSEPSATSTSSAPETSVPPLSSTITESTISKATSSAVPHTVTSTLEGGGVTVITSTSWVAIAPPPAQETSEEPDLQDDASRPRVGMVVPVVMGFMVGGMLMV